MTEELKARIAQINAGKAPAGYKKTKVGIFPSDWREERIGDLFYKVNERNNGQFDKTKWISVAKMYYQEPEKVTSNNIDTRTYVMRLGDMAFEGHPNKEFQFGRFVVNDLGDGIISELFPIYRHKKENVNNYWKYAIQFESIMARIFIKCITMSGASSNKINNDEFIKEKLYIPPLPEQQKIAEILTAQDAVIALMQKQIKLKQQQKKYLMQKLLSGEVRVGSGEWKKVKLGALCTFIRNGFTYTPSTPELGAKITRIETISDRMINLNNVGYATRPIDNKYRLQKGDILFSHINSLSQIGKTALFNLDDELYHGMNLLCIRANKEVIPLFLFLLLNSQKANAYYKAYAKKAINQCSISASELTKMTFIIPSLPEQVKIAEILSAQDKEIELLQQQLALEQQKKKALMQLLLTGKVRCV